jgi:hypothetical protein
MAHYADVILLIVTRRYRLALAARLTEVLMGLLTQKEMMAEPLLSEGKPEGLDSGQYRQAVEVAH